MKYFRHLLSSVVIVNACFVTSAHALVVDFEEFVGVSEISNTFIGELDLSESSETFRLANKTYGAFGGISFSGGVLLQSPLDSNAMPIAGDGGSIYYGTAFSPSTSIPSVNYTNTLSIDITSDENVTNVAGSFVHGLNTALDGQGVLVDYAVNYYTEGLLSPIFSQNITGVPFIDGAGVVSFGLDTDTIMGSLLGSLINRVEISTPGYDFIGRPPEQLEWDFLLSAVSFNEAASPVPVPAALPLFMSALLGGFVAARRKKTSDHKVSS
jgi:hypothetical protein